eukprot:TRINITY_DN716_c0_g7_i1.p1 TRINITY_DN716_c0_g7~~TRINITY_DN716_c0_g7_i1.p1  ORF type:complete len:439 (+),score=160.56 TRINITY_DN716_c0_g7_i1:763-2079(+)
MTNQRRTYNNYFHHSKMKSKDKLISKIEELERENEEIKSLYENEKVKNMFLSEKSSTAASSSTKKKAQSKTTENKKKNKARRDRSDSDDDDEEENDSSDEDGGGNKGIEQSEEMEDEANSDSDEEEENNNNNKRNHHHHQQQQQQNRYSSSDKMISLSTNASLSSSFEISSWDRLIDEVNSTLIKGNQSKVSKNEHELICAFAVSLQNMLRSDLLRFKSKQKFNDSDFQIDDKSTSDIQQLFSSFKDEIERLKSENRQSKDTVDILQKQLKTLNVSSNVEKISSSFAMEILAIKTLYRMKKQMLIEQLKDVTSQCISYQSENQLLREQLSISTQESSSPKKKKKDKENVSNKPTFEDRLMEELRTVTTQLSQTLLENDDLKSKLQRLKQAESINSDKTTSASSSSKYKTIAGSNQSKCKILSPLVEVVAKLLVLFRNN